jgi:hypothetical protein
MAFAIIEPDLCEVQLSLALMLYDGFTGGQELVGDISISLSYEPLTSPLGSPLNSPPQSFQPTFKRPYRKAPQAVFLYFGLLTGEYVAHVGSNVDLPEQTPPYYLPADISIAVADLPVTAPVQQPIWPAFPDINLADDTKPLDDPTQNPAYRAQRLAATLQPSTAYPFPAGSTLVRGTVYINGTPLAGATVQSSAAQLPYLTGEDGGFVLFFTQISGLNQTITLQATHALHPAVQQNVEVHRGMTVTTSIIMAP